MKIGDFWIGSGPTKEEIQKANKKWKLNRVEMEEEAHQKAKGVTRFLLVVIVILVIFMLYKGLTAKSYTEPDRRYEDDSYWEDDACPAPY